MDEKYSHLLTLLGNYSKIGIAYSGGIDSTLLLHAAFEALGADKVIPLHISSTLNARASIIHCRTTYRDNFGEVPQLQEVTVHPLSWKEFTCNTDLRCYHCKRRMYETLMGVLASQDCYFLADGTNLDDLKEHRPGLQAIDELKILTPLVEAGLTKSKIREVARQKGLSNYNLPSNSCLATRIQPGVTITERQLRVIEQAEQFLHTLGYQGCRVRLFKPFVIIELQKDDLERFMQSTPRNTVQEYFRALGCGSPMLSIEGR